MTYLEGTVSTLSDDYALSIVSYSLSLAKSSSATTVFARLNNDAVVKGNKNPYVQLTITE